jgi:hypothetical protein
MPLTNFLDGLRNRLKEPGYVVALLQAALEEGGEEGFRIAMEEVIRVWQYRKATPLAKSVGERQTAIEAIKELMI